MPAEAAGGRQAGRPGDAGRDEASGQAAGDEAGFATSAPFAVQMRFSDTDRLGHVNNAVYATYAETARLAFLAELGMTDQGLILARLAVDFVRQVRLGDECEVVSRVLRIGNTRFTLAQTLTANGEVAAEVEAVLVCFDYEAQRPMRVPDAFRTALAGGAAGSRG